MTAETCGMSDMPAKVAPPLKSTSTMLSCSGECVIASPSTSVRRNSDLPEPVAPMTRPCGPMPCWADSLRSRWAGAPPSPTPIGTRSRSRAGRGRQAASASKDPTSPRPSRSMRSGVPERSLAASSGTPVLPAVTVCSAVSRRAKASAVARSHWSPLARTGCSRTRTASSGTGAGPRPGGSPAPSPASGPASSTASRSRVGSSSSSHREGRSTTVTPCSPSGGTTWFPGGRSAPSRTSRTCGVAGRSSAPKRGRSARSGGSSSASSSREVVTIRRGPTASVARALWECGSHFTQSQWASWRSPVSTATTRCSGEEKAVAEQSRARARAREGSSGPQTSMRSKARRSMLAGRSGWLRCTTSSRCRADAAAGSTWSMGALSGGTSRSASSWLHTPYRTWRKVGSVAPRSHTRLRSSASAGRDAGSGCCQVIARRCWAAASRATARTEER